jgi:predicted transcriptional regulator
MGKYMKYTSRPDIMARVLQSMSSGDIALAKVYLAFLEKEYVAFLENNGFIRFDAPSNTYAMTEEGAKILGKPEDLGTLLNLEHKMSTEIRKGSGGGESATQSTTTETTTRNRTKIADRRREMDSRPITIYA